MPWFYVQNVVSAPSVPQICAQYVHSNSSKAILSTEDIDSKALYIYTPSSLYREIYSRFYFIYTPSSLYRGHKFQGNTIHSLFSVQRTSKALLNIHYLFSVQKTYILRHYYIYTPSSLYRGNRFQDHTIYTLPLLCTEDIDSKALLYIHFLFSVQRTLIDSMALL